MANMATLTSLGRTSTQRWLLRSCQPLSRLSNSTPTLSAPSLTSGALNQELPAHSTVLRPQAFSTSAIQQADASAESSSSTTPARKTRASESKTSKQPSAAKQGGRKKKAAAAAKKATKAKSKRAKKTASKEAKERKALKKAAGQRKELRKAALLDEPKRLPATTWLLYLHQNQDPAAGSSGGLAAHTNHVKECANRYRNLSPEEVEQLNHTTNQNAAKNKAEYARWVASHSAQAIKDANNARKQLAKLQSSKSSKRAKNIRLIKDDRTVSRPSPPYVLFYQDRFRSGDFRGLKVSEAAKLAGKEWHEASAAEKQPFIDQAEALLKQYAHDYKTVYGVDLPASKPRKRS